MAPASEARAAGDYEKAMDLCPEKAVASVLCEPRRVVTGSMPYARPHARNDISMIWFYPHKNPVK